MTKNSEKKSQNYNKERRSELLNYDKKQHLELLKDYENLTRKLKLKFFGYLAIQFNQLNWEIKDQYLELIKNYMEGEIDSFYFIMKFEERYESIGKVTDLLELNRVLLSPHQNSFRSLRRALADFAYFLSKIDSCCKAYSDNPEPFQQAVELTDVQFRNQIQKIYRKIEIFFLNHPNL